MEKQAFSSIELMVVIEIIAILVIVAVPAYNSYLFQAKIDKVMPSLDAIATNMINFAAQKGYFPSANSQNFPDDAEFVATIPVPAQISNDVTYVVVNGDTCGANGDVEIYMNYLLPGQIFYFDMYVYHINGTVQRFCNYYYGQPGNFGTADIINNGCLNGASTEALDRASFLFNSSTCM